MPLPYILTNGPQTKPDADKFMANYYWLFATLKGTFIANGGLESWAAGTGFTNPADGTTLADSWVLEKGGTLSPVANVGREPTIIDSGAYSLGLDMGTAGSSNSYVRIKQSVPTPTRFAGNTILFGVMVKCATANKVRLSITDGVTTAYSPYHAGDGAWQKLEVALVCDSAPTEITVRFDVTGDFDSDTVYFDSAFLYVIEAAMSEVARQALDYFSPDQAAAIVASTVTTAALILTAQTSDPASPATGQIWYNSVDDQFKGKKAGATPVILG